MSHAADYGQFFLLSNINASTNSEVIKCFILLILVIVYEALTYVYFLILLPLPAYTDVDRAIHGKRVAGRQPIPLAPPWSRVLSMALARCLRVDGVFGVVNNCVAVTPLCVHVPHIHQRVGTAWAPLGHHRCTPTTVIPMSNTQL